METTQTKKKHSFPTAISVLFIVLVFASLLTLVIPAGSYAKLAYDSDAQAFEVTEPNGDTTDYPATQESLDKFGVTGSLDKFLDGSINKPVAIPNTYERVEQKPQGIKAFLMAPINGVYESIDIILFILLIGGCLGVLMETGAFNAGIAWLSEKTKGHEYLLIILLMILIALGGTTFGLAEETIALFPILMPFFLTAGYDAMTCIATVYMASTIGSMYSTINPFSMGTASNAAGISLGEGLGIRTIALIIGTVITTVYILRYAKKVKEDPTKSIVYDQYEEHREAFQHSEVLEFTRPMKWSLLVFGITFIILIYGLVVHQWWFDAMTALFLACSIALLFVSGLGEKHGIDAYIKGASDMLSVALVVGVARGVNIILEQGMVSDTLLYFFSNLVKNMNPMLFIIFMLIIFIILGFFIASSSGLAMLSIPIMAPLAAPVGVPTAAILSAYVFGQGLMSFITPTGLILASLAMVNVTYDRWLKFIMPLMGIIGVLNLVILIAQVWIG